MNEPQILLQQDNLQSGEVIALLQQHRVEMLKHSPPESVHALDSNALYADNLTFWSARIDDQFAGCIGLKALDEWHGEIKSMKTVPTFLRCGVASALLTHVIDQARQRSYQRLSLETGTMAVFKPAKTLYERNGFIECEPFADYRKDPLSVCMTLKL